MEIYEHNLEDEQSYHSISEENSLNLNDFINFPLNNDEQSSEETAKEDKKRYHVDRISRTELKNKNKILNRSNSHSGLSTLTYYSNTPRTLFNVINTSNKQTNKLGKKFAGRKRKNPITFIEGERIHEKTARDNVTRKIQVHAMNSIIQFVNEIISKIDVGLENIPVFQKIDYSFIKDIRSDKFEINKTKTIENFLEADISPKYKTLPHDYNKKEKEKIKKNVVIKNILSITYVDFFKEIFYKNKREIDLSKFGLENKIILLSKVKLYEDMLNENMDERWSKRAEDVIKKNFCFKNFSRK